MSITPPANLIRMIAALGFSGFLVACGNDGQSSTPSASASGSNASSSNASSLLVKVNQLGFLPESAKVAIVPDVAATRFKLINAGTMTEVFSGTLSAAAMWDASGESVKVADFSSVKIPGDYQVRVDGLTDSQVFSIAPDVYSALTAASIKAFYFNRSGIELLPEFAGKFARPLGHPDTQVLIHPSAASDARPAGTVVSSPKGWYDAGDYNKYIVNSGIST